MHDYLKAVTFAPLDETNDFWVYVQQRWGGGSPYRDDVLTHYADELPPAIEFLVAAAEDCWRDILIDPILAYLG